MLLWLIGCTTEQVESWRVTQNLGEYSCASSVAEHTFTDVGPAVPTYNDSSIEYTSSESILEDVVVLRTGDRVRFEFDGWFWEGTADEGALVLATEALSGTEDEQGVADYIWHTASDVAFVGDVDAVREGRGWSGTITHTSFATTRYEESDTWSDTAAGVIGPEGRISGYAGDWFSGVENGYASRECEGFCLLVIETECTSEGDFSVETL